jgi:hypothetical protein
VKKIKINKIDEELKKLKNLIFEKDKLFLNFITYVLYKKNKVYDSSHLYASSFNALIIMKIPH